VALTAGHPLQRFDAWLAAAVLSWTVAVVSPRWARPALVAGLVPFLVYHVGSMSVAEPHRLIPMGSGSWYWG
jgi:hypothetical protein